MLSVKHLVSAAVLSLVTAGPAFSTVAYYRFENNLTSQDNSPTLDATAGSTAGYSTDLPGTMIHDPWANTTVPNSYSYNHGTGTGSALSDTSILNNTTSTGGFTVEAFIKLTSTDVNDLKFDLIIGNMDGAGTQGWLFGLNSAGVLRFSGVQNNGASYKEISANTAISPGWHHVAAVGTFTDRTGTGLVDFTDVHLFLDYVDVTAQSGSAIRFFGPASSGDPGNKGPVFVDSTINYTIGAVNPFSGLIDELRISENPLSTTQMLQAQVPEPAGLLMIGLTGLGLVARRRR